MIFEYLNYQLPMLTHSDLGFHLIPHNLITLTHREAQGLYTKIPNLQDLEPF